MDILHLMKKLLKQHMSDQKKADMNDVQLVYFPIIN